MSSLLEAHHAFRQAQTALGLATVMVLKVTSDDPPATYAAAVHAYVKALELFRQSVVLFNAAIGHEEERAHGLVRELFHFSAGPLRELRSGYPELDAELKELEQFIPSLFDSQSERTPRH